MDGTGNFFPGFILSLTMNSDPIRIDPGLCETRTASVHAFHEEGPYSSRGWMDVGIRGNLAFERGGCRGQSRPNRAGREWRAWDRDC